ncbi:MAG: hypothetical protein ACP5UN_02500 [Candidatus Micrarchaeia archaeon]
MLGKFMMPNYLDYTLNNHLAQLVYEKIDEKYKINFSDWFESNKLSCDPRKLSYALNILLILDKEDLNLFFKTTYEELNNKHKVDLFGVSESSIKLREDFRTPDDLLFLILNLYPNSKLEQYLSLYKKSINLSKFKINNDESQICLSGHAIALLSDLMIFYNNKKITKNIEDMNFKLDKLMNQIYKIKDQFGYGANMNLLNNYTLYENFILSLIESVSTATKEINNTIEYRK